MVQRLVLSSLVVASLFAAVSCATPQAEEDAKPLVPAAKAAPEAATAAAVESKPPSGISSLFAPSVTKETFEPVYRAAKAIQGATQSGVTYVKFGELMQTFSTELSIAKDHPLNDADKKLLAVYADAYGHYQTSALLWKLKIDARDDLWKGEIPIYFVTRPVPDMLTMMDTYEIPVTDHGDYRTVPGDAMTYVWKTADKTLDKATALYYGK